MLLNFEASTLHHTQNEIYLYYMVNYWVPHLILYTCNHMYINSACGSFDARIQVPTFVLGECSLLLMIASDLIWFSNL